MKVIWSEVNESMIVAGFTYKNHHYTWNEADEMYWRDDVDDEGFDLEMMNRFSRAGYAVAD